mgnify:CR=1 FL=1
MSPGRPLGEMKVSHWFGVWRWGNLKDPAETSYAVLVKRIKK